MTTGRINQISHLRAPGFPPGGSPPGPIAPEGAEVRYKEGTHEASGRSGFPGVPGESRTTIQLPPLSPSAPVRTQGSRRPPSRAAGGCGIRPSGGGAGPRGTTPANGGYHRAASSRNLASGMASSQPSTDSNGAGGQKAPGLRSPQHRTGTTADKSPSVLAVGPRPHPTSPRKAILQAWKIRGGCPVSAG